MDGIISYRVFLLEFVACPSGEPATAAERDATTA